MRVVVTYQSVYQFISVCRDWIRTIIHPTVRLNWMPTVVPLYKRKQRRNCAAAGITSPTASTSRYSTACCSPVPFSPNRGPGACFPFSPTGSPAGGGLEATCCLLCRKDIRYYQETLTCGHIYHSDCYWRWIRARSNLPEEKSICPRCGFLQTPADSDGSSSPFWKVGPVKGTDRTMSEQRRRKNSTSSSSSSSSSGSDSQSGRHRFLCRSTSSGSDSSSDTASDIFFL